MKKNEIERVKINNDIAEFLKNGGKIEKVKAYTDKPINSVGYGRGLGDE